MQRYIQHQKLIMRANREIFQITSVWNRKETTGSCGEFMQSRAGGSLWAHFNYDIARLNYWLHSHKQSVTANSKQATGFCNRAVSDSGWSAAILAVSVNNISNWCCCTRLRVNTVCFETSLSWRSYWGLHTLIIVMRVINIYLNCFCSTLKWYNNWMHKFK